MWEYEIDMGDKDIGDDSLYPRNRYKYIEFEKEM